MIQIKWHGEKRIRTPIGVVDDVVENVEIVSDALVTDLQSIPPSHLHDHVLPSSSCSPVPQESISTHAHIDMHAHIFSY